MKPFVSSAEHNELVHVDALRFCASLGIVLCHSMEFLYRPDARELAHAQGAGLALYVDMFFVMSGFIICRIYGRKLNGLSDVGAFVQRRIGRLFPLHLATLALSLLIVLAMSISNVTANHVPAITFGCVAATAVLVQAFTACEGISFNGVSWSISAEMAMYVIFPLLLRVTNGSAPRTFLLALASLIFVAYWHGSGSNWADHQDAWRALPGFLLGMTFMRIQPHLARIPKPHLWLLTSNVLMLVGSGCRWPEQPMLALAYITPAFAIAADERTKTAPWADAVAPMGQLAYSIYMVHGLLILIFMNVVGDKILHLDTSSMLVLASLTYAAIVSASWLSWRYFELPTRRLIDALYIFNSDVSHRAVLPARSPP